MTLRILHAVQELGHGGAESVCATLVEAAVEDGMEAAVAAAPGPFAHAFRVPHFPLPMVQRSPLPLLRAAGALRRAAQAWRADVIHCHNPAMALAATLATGRGRTPAKLVTIHGLSDRDYRLHAWIVRWLGQPVVACGPGVAARLRAHGLAATVIANGCPPAPPPLSRAALEAQFPALRGRALVVGVGRLAAVKGFGTLVRASARVPRAMTVIAGEGPERAALERASRAEGVADRLALPGHRDDARALLGAADVAVITSRDEGLPLVAIEAMMAGTPIVAARSSWQHGVLRDGHNALLVPFGDAEATARAVELLLDDASQARRIAQNARESARAYAATRMIDSYLALYRSLIPVAP